MSYSDRDDKRVYRLFKGLRKHPDLLFHKLRHRFLESVWGLAFLLKSTIRILVQRRKKSTKIQIL